MVASPAFRPSVETLDQRVLPALLSLSAPVSVFAAARVAPIACAPAALDLDARVAVNLNATLGSGACAPACPPAQPVCPPAAATTGLGLTAQVGARVGADVRVGGLVNATVGGALRLSAGVDLAVGLADSLATGYGPRAPRRC